MFVYKEVEMVQEICVEVHFFDIWRKELFRNVPDSENIVMSNCFHSQFLFFFGGVGGLRRT